MTTAASDASAVDPPADLDPRVAQIRSWSASRRWRYALKPASWPKLLVPMVLGVLTGLGATGPTRRAFVGLVVAVLFTVLDLVFIVLLNDWGDRHVDAIKREMFPTGCSPKTIPDGILSSGALLRGGLVAGALAVALGFIAGPLIALPLLGWASLGALGIFVAYTLPPLALNYRGGGELLEALGVGAALPMLGAYCVAGSPMPGFLPTLLPGFVALSLSSALASGLSDEESDRAGGKRTFTTMFGNGPVRRAVTALVFLGAALFVAVPLLVPGTHLLPGAVGALVASYYGVATQRLSPAATTNAFAAQGAFKGALHHAIWRGTTLAAGAACAIDLLR